jgi:ABC-2 type transport system ATP-binding protein
MQVRVVHLKKHFGRTRAVDDINFSFASGEVFGFIGPNGAGKTTTIRILATLLEPTGGNAFVDGVSIVEDPEKARRIIGYVPDTLPTHNDMTVHEYLDFFARAYSIRANRRRKVIESIEEFTNLRGIRDKFIHALSKGMKQRVSLARSLVHDPPALVMDEPAAGLDPRARVELRELIKILAEQGKAILISSHILTELAEICTGAVIIEQGKLLRAGRIEQLQTQDTAVRMLLIRPLEKLEELHKELLQMPNIESAHRVGEALRVEIQGSDQEMSDLLTELIGKGYRLTEFRQEKAGLEDIFMNLTQGKVQ